MCVFCFGLALSMRCLQAEPGQDVHILHTLFTFPSTYDGLISYMLCKYVIAWVVKYRTCMVGWDNENLDTRVMQVRYSMHIG